MDLYVPSTSSVCKCLRYFVSQCTRADIVLHIKREKELALIDALDASRRKHSQTTMCLTRSEHYCDSDSDSDSIGAPDIGEVTRSRATPDTDGKHLLFFKGPTQGITRVHPYEYLYS